MIPVKYTGDALWQRIERAVEIVKDRLRRVTQALNAAEVPYAVIGGNAVQFWVAQVDESVVRNTRDVDIILNRSDLPRAIDVLEQVGFLYRPSAAVSMFLDGPNASGWPQCRGSRCGACDLRRGKGERRVSGACSECRTLRSDPVGEDSSPGITGADEADIIST